MNQTQANRMATILYFFKQLKDEECKLSVFTKGTKDQMYSSRHCGAVGCFAGWLPVVFPTHFRYRELKHLQREHTDRLVVPTFSDWNDVDNDTDRLQQFLGVEDDCGLFDMVRCGDRPSGYTLQGEKFRHIKSDREVIIKWIEKELDKAGYEA